jgi:hypothetical protein
VSRPVRFIPAGHVQVDAVAGRHVAAFVVDARPVSRGDWARFCAATGREFTVVANLEDAVVDVGPQDAAACAAWLGMRLPTLWEWQRFARGRFGLTPAPEHQPFAIEHLCERWEWTSTSAPVGFWVCGGVDRQHRGSAAATVDHVAYEDGPAQDVGFRCVRDATPQDAQVAPSSSSAEATVIIPALQRPPPPPPPPRPDPLEFVRIGDVVCRWEGHEPRGLRVHAGGRTTPAAVSRDGWQLHAQLSVMCSALGIPDALQTFQASVVDDGFLQARDDVPGTELSTFVRELRQNETGRLPVDVACGIARFLADVEVPIAMRRRTSTFAMRLSWEGRLHLATDLLLAIPDGTLRGDFWAMPQEAIRGQPDSPSSTSFHIAALLFHLLAPQWHFDHPIDLIRATLDGSRPPLRTFRDDVDRGLASLIDASLREHAQRPDPLHIRQAVAAVAVDAPDFLAGLARGLLPQEREADLRFWEEAELVDVGAVRVISCAPLLERIDLEEGLRQLDEIAARRT